MHFHGRQTSKRTEQRHDACGFFLDGGAGAGAGPESPDQLQNPLLEAEVRVGVGDVAEGQRRGLHRGAEADVVRAVA